MAEKSTEKYEKLAGNTMIFAISSFSSKLLSFFVKPMLSYFMEDASVMGVSTLAANCANLLIPLVSLGIANGILRFGLDKTTDRKALFSSSLLTIFMGFGILVVMYPMVRLVPMVSDYVILIYIYVLASCLRTLCTQFARGQQWNKLVAVEGVFCTVATFAFYALFLVVIPMGANGYLLAIICGDLSGGLLMFTMARLYRFLDLRRFSKQLWREMMKFSLPMIPAQISFWIINSSDTFIVGMLCDGWQNQLGTYWTGLLAAAYTLPSILTTLGSIFYEAWQLSAVTEESEREKFFTHIFSVYSGIMACCCAGIVMLCQPLMLVFNSQYHSAWRLVPFLALASVCACFNQFYNSIYVVYKKSVSSLFTMMAGAAANVVLDVALCIWVGPIGATVASFLGLALVFVLRVINTRKYLKIRINPGLLLVDLGLILAETAVQLWQLPGAAVITVACTALVIVINWAAVYSIAGLILPRVLGKRLGGKAVDLIGLPLNALHGKKR